MELRSAQAPCFPDKPLSQQGSHFSQRLRDNLRLHLEFHLQPEDSEQLTSPISLSHAPRGGGAVGPLPVGFPAPPAPLSILDPSLTPPPPLQLLQSERIFMSHRGSRTALGALGLLRVLFCPKPSQRLALLLGGGDATPLLCSATFFAEPFSL